MQISFEEIVNLMQQMYPDQTARVVAELKASKFEQLYNESLQQQNGQPNGQAEALHEVHSANPHHSGNLNG